MLSQIQEQDPSDSDSIAFLLTLLLYAHLAKYNSFESILGFQISWRNALIALSRLDWENTEANLLVRGHDFESFSAQYFPKLEIDPRDIEALQGCWNRIQPLSVAGHAGWLDLNDVVVLYNRINENDQDSPKQFALQETQAMEEIEVCHKSKSMLVTAINARLGLCLILSG